MVTMVVFIQTVTVCFLFCSGDRLAQVFLSRLFNPRDGAAVTEEWSSAAATQDGGWMDLGIMDG